MLSLIVLSVLLLAVVIFALQNAQAVTGASGSAPLWTRRLRTPAGLSPIGPRRFSSWAPL